MRRDAIGWVCPVWAGPLVLALFACALLWGSRFVPVQGCVDSLTLGGFACAFFAVRGIWGLPGVER
jgi:hypothetical protein